MLHRKSPDGQYYVICLDLNLIDKRETLDEAIAALDENILGYLASVQAHGDAATAIPRPVSFGGWLRFYRLSILNTLLLLFGRRVDGFLAYAKKQAPTLAPVTKLAYA